MPQALALDNLPTQKHERFKYTNIKRALPAQLSPVERQEEIIHIACGEVRENPVEVLWKGQEGIHHQPVLKIALEEGASVTIIERHEGAGSYWKNMTSDITLAPNAKLTHIRVIEDSEEAVLTNNVALSADTSAVYDSFTLVKGAKLSRQDIYVQAIGEHVDINFNGVMALKGAQHGDISILIEHQVPNGNSSQFFRNVLDEQATGVFQGKVHVFKDAQKTDAQQMCKSLLLSERTEMNTKPELEIYADDVLCAHGATTGQIDPMQLFYMRSRGISEIEARKLLMKAFVQESIDKIKDEDIRLTIEEKIEI